MMETFLKKFEESNPVKCDKIVKKISESVDSPGTVATFLSLNLTLCSYTTLLPILQKWPEEFRGLIERALVDLDMKTDLEDGKLINWCRTAQILYPINTTKDGNCLLHSISLYIWGVEDHSLLLRRLLYCTLQTDEHQVFKSRYFQFMKTRNDVHGNLLLFDSSGQEQEWRSIVDAVEPKHIPSFALPLSFLEPIHIYVMANILKRPIIVMADPRIRTYEAVSIQDNDIVGIYLPLDIQPGQCYKYPVVLGFNFNHFTPLVTTKEDPHSPRKLSIPLQKHDLSMLPVRFLYAVEERQIGNLMTSYLHLIDLVHSEPISGAKLGDKTLPEDLNLTQEYFKDCETKYRRFLNVESPQGVFGNQRPMESVGQQDQNLQQIRQVRNTTPPTMSQFQTVRCITQGCTMYGSASTGNMCSECLKKYTMENTGPPLSLFFNEQEPTAPPPSRPLNSMSNMMSMIEQKCQTPGCEFMCSLNTYPLCHECKEKTLKPAEKLTVNVHRQASNQSEELRNLSARLSTNVQTGINLTPLTQSTSKQGTGMNSHLSESELFGAGNGCLGEIEVPSGNDFNSQTHLVSNMRKEAEVIPNEYSQRRPSPQFGSPKKVKSSCSNPGCHGTSISGNSLCSLCYVRKGIPGLQEATNQDSPTHQLTNQRAPIQRSINRNSPILQPTNQNPFPQQSTNQHQAGVSKHQSTPLGATSTSKPSNGLWQKHLCSTASCNGIRQENRLGMCVTCFEGVPLEKVKEPTVVIPGLTGLKELDINRHGSIEDNLEVSETPSDAMIEPRQISCMDDDSTKCASPLCDTLVYLPNKLCQNCLDVLRQHHPSPNKQPKLNQVKKPRCKKTGCLYHGAARFDGFCSGCYNSVLAGNLHIVTNNNSAPISRQNKYPVETPQPRSNSAPITKKGAICKVEGCSYFGDPKFSNMCTNCYQIFKPKSADLTGSEKYPVQEASLSQGASNLVSNSFDRSAQVLEQSRKEQTICRRYECKNHGNSNCEGFCNDCFKKYYVPVCRNNIYQIG